LHNDNLFRYEIISYIIYSKYNKYLYFLSKNSRVLSKWKQWTYCKGLSTAKESTWDKLNVILSRKPDYKWLPFLFCCWEFTNRYNSVENLLYLFDQFTLDEKQDIKIIRSYINIFYSIIIKYVNIYDVLDELLLNLSRIKSE